MSLLPPLSDDRAAQIRATSACALRDRLHAGEVSALEVAEAFLQRIALREPEIHAFAWHDPEDVRAQARRLDAARAAGAPLGPLHGLPVGLKDVIDTAGIPTESGCALDAGRVPARDAHVVVRLRAAGAVIMGKTVTTELAFLHPGPTRNPHNMAHTPGGSSSGSAAAVADGMLPLAIGTQTGGSVIRPASFCGIVGYKPTFGAIGRTGVTMQSHTLDTLGVFARSPADAALLADAIMGADPGDDASLHDDMPALSARMDDPLADPLHLAFLRLPGWERADEEMLNAFHGFAVHVGATLVDTPEVFDAAADQRALINNVEIAHYYGHYADRDAGKLSPMMRTAIATGRAAAATDYAAALAARGALHQGARRILESYDAILCPAALGTAPAGLGSTGDSIFNGLWTFTGMPAVTVPVLRAANGLPMGVQIVTDRGQDARALQIADLVARQAAAR